MQSQTIKTINLDNLESIFNYYLDHQSELVPKYGGRHIVLSNNGVQGDFGTMEEAYDFGVSKFGLGNFIVQLCTEGDKAYTQTFHTRAIFA